MWNPRWTCSSCLRRRSRCKKQLMHAQQALADAEVDRDGGRRPGQGHRQRPGRAAGPEHLPSAVEPGDADETVRTIADLVLAAVRDAYRAAEDLQQQQMGPFAAAMQGGGIPGMPGMPGCRAVSTCPAGWTCPASASAPRARTPRAGRRG